VLRRTHFEFGRSRAVVLGRRPGANASFSEVCNLLIIRGKLPTRTRCSDESTRAATFNSPLATTNSEIQTIQTPMKSTLLLASSLLASSLAVSAAVTYVDATLSNTTLANGAVLPTPATSGTADNQWDNRAFGNGDIVFTSNGGGAEDAPRIKTTITGLNAGESYTISTYFWGNADSWRGRTSLTDEAGDLPGYNTNHGATSSFPPMTYVTFNVTGSTRNPGPLTTDGALVGDERAPAPCVDSPDQRITPELL